MRSRLNHGSFQILLLFQCFLSQELADFTPMVKGMRRQVTETRNVGDENTDMCGRCVLILAVLNEVGTGRLKYSVDTWS